MSLPDLRKTLARAARRPAIWLGAVLALSILRGLPYLDFVPMWDAMIYGSCIARAAIGGLEFHSLICAGHPTVGYVGLLVLPNYWFGVHYGWVILVNLVLGAAALWAFYGLLRRQFPGRRDAPEILWMTTLLSFQPLVLAGALSVNPDYGVYCFFLLFLNALQRRQTFWPVLWGLFLVFSKEVGVLLFGLATALQFVADLMRREYGFRRWLLRASVFALPPALLGLFLLYKSSDGTEGLWYGVKPQQILFDSLLHFDAADPSFQNYITQIAILQFSWIAIAVIPLGWIRRGIALLGRVLKHPSSIPRSGLFASLLLLGSTYLLTRFKTICNMRYFLALIPLILWVFYQSLRALLTWTKARMAVLAGMTVLFLVSNYRTIDPVSKEMFGTFDFGAHSMLGLASYAHECCCRARDQLVYNVEHTNLHYLQEEVFQDLKPQLQAQEPLVVYPQSDWRNLGPVYASTMKRALGYALAASLNVVDENRVEAVASRVTHGYFLALPNCEDRAFKDRLRAFFTVTKMKTYERSGYAIELYELRRKG